LAAAPHAGVTAPATVGTAAHRHTTSGKDFSLATRGQEPAVTAAGIEERAGRLK
jgi:hypothetical protein